MDIVVRQDGAVAHAGRLSWPGGALRCAIGRTGIRTDKREGDGATPAGAFSLRRVLWRADRVTAPVTALPSAPIGPRDGWCDDPGHADYNRPVPLPFDAGHEAMWRADGLYDVVVVIGHNDDPPVPGLGSAVFVHVATADFGPTAGCVALERGDLLRLLADCRPGDQLVVEG